MAREAGGVDIGARLRAARERKGLTILQSAEKLHVDARVLEALEAGDFASLGAAVYVRGHLRHYADLVGESSAALQDLYASENPATHPDLTRIPRGEGSPDSSPLVLPALLAVVGLALAGAVWWLFTLPDTKPDAAVAAAAPVAAPPADSAAGQQSAGPAQAAATDADAHAATVLPLPAAASAPAPGHMQMDLKFAAASWVQIWDARGHPLLHGLMPAGSSRVVTGLAPLRVVLGNATAVTLAVNGRALSLDGMVRRRGDAHVQVNASGQVSAASTQIGPGD